MTQSKNPTLGGAIQGSERETQDLTQEQRTTLSRITNRFRDGAVVQTLSGPREAGKTLIGELVGHCLENEAETVRLFKHGDLSQPQKRLMNEAYSSYPFFLAAVLKQLGFFAQGEEADLVEQMVERLRALRREEKRLLIVIDDAQDLNPAVWKRFQSWLDFQDRGIRMIQVLLVGSPALRKIISEPMLRGWRRYIHGTHTLPLLGNWGSAVDELRRMLKRACEVINEKNQPPEPIVPPHVTLFAAHKILRESGGRPGRLRELLRRCLSASIREGGCAITRRFLSHADALRSPTLQWYKLRRPKSSAKLHPKSAESAGKADAANRSPRVPDHPLGWLRYALGTLLVVFVLGAGWGITAWLSVPGPSEESPQLSESEEIAGWGENADLLVETEAVSEESGLSDLDSPTEIESIDLTESYPLDVFNEVWSESLALDDVRAKSASLEAEFDRTTSVDSGDSSITAETVEIPPLEESVFELNLDEESHFPPRTASAEKAVHQAGLQEEEPKAASRRLSRKTWEALAKLESALR